MLCIESDASADPEATFQLRMPSTFFNLPLGSSAGTRRTAPLLAWRAAATTASFSIGFREQVEYTSLPWEESNWKPLLSIASCNHVTCNAISSTETSKIEKRTYTSEIYNAAYGANTAATQPECDEITCSMCSDIPSAESHSVAAVLFFRAVPSPEPVPPCQCPKTICRAQAITQAVAQ